MDYLPDIYQEFRRQFPKVAEAYDGLAGECHNWGPLDEKTRRLVKLGVAIGLNSEGAVKSHTRQAMEKGVTVAELHHVILLALTTTGFPTMIAALKWMDEVIAKREK